MTSSGWRGCCPCNARRAMMRWMDSAMLSQLPPSGVYSTMIPLANIHRSISAFRRPTMLSQTSSIRRGGNFSGRVIFTDSPSCQLLHSARFSSLPGASLSGRRSRTADNSSLSQGWSIASVVWRTPRALTSPVAGWDRVRSLAVPRRTYSWDLRFGLPAGSQLAPGHGTVWYGPASSSVHTERSAFSPSV